MNDEKIINAFKEANFWGNDNLYFSGAVLPTTGQYVVFGVFANISLNFLIINKNEQGIGIIPIDQISGKPRVEQLLVINNANINSVTFNKAGLFWYKNINIISKSNEAISFKVQKNVLTIKNHKINLQKFIESYSW